VGGLGAGLAGERYRADDRQGDASIGTNDGLGLQLGPSDRVYLQLIAASETIFFVGRGFEGPDGLNGIELELGIRRLVGSGWLSLRASQHSG
jgi:hypothetical protein